MTADLRPPRARVVRAHARREGPAALPLNGAPATTGLTPGPPRGRIMDIVATGTPPPLEPAPVVLRGARAYSDLRESRRRGSGVAFGGVVVLVLCPASHRGMIHKALNGRAEFVTDWQDLMRRAKGASCLVLDIEQLPGEWMERIRSLRGRAPRLPIVLVLPLSTATPLRWISCEVLPSSGAMTCGSSCAPPWWVLAWIEIPKCCCDGCEP